MDSKRAAIHAAAIGEFSQRGYAGTSMANIAEAAGMSRPALYQYFENKGDIYASAFVALITAQVDRALEALNESDELADQLDGLLQRFEGDLWEQMAASPHSEEVLSAKSEQVATDMRCAVEQLWGGLGEHLTSLHPGRSAAAVGRRSDWVDVLHFGPKGFKFDRPPIDVFRRRLRTLANSVAAEIETYR